jgi:hypothetical protein
MDWERPTITHLTTYRPPVDRMNWHELRKAQDTAIAHANTRELIPQPGGLKTWVAFALEQQRRLDAGEKLMPEKDVLWRDMSAPAPAPITEPPYPKGAA